jgi:hypothetical protein
MAKKVLGVILILGIVFGITFSILNFLPKKAEAKMIDQLLWYEEIPGGYIYKCFSTGNGCHTVIPDE